MKIANQSLLRSDIEEVNEYTVIDNEKTIVAIPKTTTKFGPSGSLKK